MSRGEGRRRLSRPHLGDDRRAVFVLSALAVAQPLFDQLARGPEFLWFHDLRAWRLGCLVAAIFVGPSVLVWLATEAVGRVRPTWRRPIYRGAASLALALLALLALRRLASDLAAVPAFVLAAAAAGGGSWLLCRRVARDLVSLLVWLVWLVPAVFLLRPEVRALVQPSARPGGDWVAAAGRSLPVVLVVWDELPVSTLMSVQGEIDGNWFPGFARLAATSTWYRDTLTASTVTSQAIPAMLSGRDPGVDASSGPADGRDLLGLLAAGHRRFGYSHTAGILPPGVRRLGGPSRAGSWLAVAADLRLLYLHLSLPSALRRPLPPVSTSWGEFGGRSSEAEKLDAAIAGLAQVAEASSESGDAPLVYLHSGLPHHPWIYLPSGARYRADDHSMAPGFSGVADTGSWTTQPWPVVQAFQRHLLQAMFADRMLSRLTDRLSALGLWDAALVIVTADHGASFAPGRPLRVATEATVAEAASVPLFVKFPGQNERRTDDRPASTLDIVPTLLDLLAIEPPWPLDGRSLAGPAMARTRTVYHPSAATVRVRRGLADEILSVVRVRRRYFGTGPDGPDPLRIGPYSELVGRPLDTLSVTPLREPWSAEIAVDADGNHFPARLHLNLAGLDGVEHPIAFAIAHDGVVVATSAIFPGGAPELWFMLDETAARRLGAASPRLFRVAVADGGPRLEEIPATSAASYRLSDDGGWIIASDGGRWRIEPRAYRGEVHPLPLPSPQVRVLAWATDDRDRPPERLVVLSEGRTIATARGGVPPGDFLDLLTFSVPEDHIFFAAFPAADDLRYFALGPDGRAAELFAAPARGSSTTKAAPADPPPAG